MSRPNAIATNRVATIPAVPRAKIRKRSLSISMKCPVPWPLVSPADVMAIMAGLGQNNESWTAVESGQAMPSARVLKPARCKLGISLGALDRAVTQIRLQGPGIGALVGQSKARCMSEHVGVVKRHPSLDASPFNEFGEARGGEWGAAFAHKDKGRTGVTFQDSQGPQFIAQQGVCCRRSTLGPSHVQGAAFELHIGPLQAALQFAMSTHTAPHL